MRRIDFSPWRLSGTVYGTLLNHRPALQALAPVWDAPPYKGAPRAPVLYVKPRNTLADGGAVVGIPADAAEVECGTSLGIVVGRTACAVSEATALDHVAGFLPVLDVSIPHPDYYRPAIRFKARDGFCPLGTPVERAAVPAPDALAVRVLVDGRPVLEASTADMVRGVARLLAEVTDFMTLAPGDVLLLGAMHPAPRVRAGQTARVEIGHLPPLTTRFAQVAP